MRVVLWLFGIIALGVSEHSHAFNPPTAQLSGWEYQWSDSTDPIDARLPSEQLESDLWFDLPPNLQAPERNGREVIWLRTDLPDKHWQDPVLFFPGVLLTFSVYVNGVEVADFPDKKKANSYPWHMVSLGQGYEGQTVMLRVYSDYSKIGTPEGVFIGSRSDHIVNMIRRDSTRGSLGFFYLIAGVVALLLAARNRDLAYVSFGLLVLASAGYTLRYTHIKQFIFDDIDFWFYIWVFSLTIMNVAFLTLIRSIFGAGRWNIISRLVTINALISAACIAILMTLIFDIPVNQAVSNFTLNLLRLFYIIDFSAVLVLVIVLARRGDADARIFLIGLPLGMTFAAYDAAWAMGLIPGGYTMGHWSSFCYIMSLVAILGRRYGQTHQRLLVYAAQLKDIADEKSHLVRDLHDGLGSITTNISLLTEMAQREASSSSQKRTLTTISELSRLGLEEIRSYMHSLDQEVETWPSLFADLRRYGVQTIEPHDLTFSFESKCVESAPDPSSLLVLNLFRIYKEGLINVIKHANASAVSINIKVDKNLLMLVINDDGVGLEKSRRESSEEISRGLASMVIRAERLGGTLQVRDEAGVRIECCLPIPIKYPDRGLDIGQES